LLEQSQKALANGDIWSAFVIVHRRYDATLLRCLEGPIAHLNARVHSFLDSAVPSPTIDPRILDQIKRAITGICTHIAALDLFVAGSCAQDTVIEQQKKGIVFYTRDPPKQPTNPLPSYKGYMLNDRLEALVCAAMLTMLCLAAGYRPSPGTLKPAHEIVYRPYYQKFVDRYPDRRSCVQLSFAAQHFREFKFGPVAKSTFRPIAESPIGPTPKPKGKGKAKKSEPSAPDVVPNAYFSLGDFQMRAGLPNDGEMFPAAMTLSWFVARIKKFSSSVE
jgi:hypothetical protein